MKKTTLLTLFLFLSCILIAQEKAIKITKPNSDKEIIIKDNKRIKIKTIDGRKVSGRVKIQNQSIMLDNETFEFEDIVEMKRNPLLTSILTSSFLIYGGALAVGFGALIGVLVDSTAYWLILPGAGMIYAGIKAPNFNRKFKNDGSWTFEIITISD